MFYVGSEGAIWDWYVENGAWKDVSLGGAVRASTSPSAVVETGSGRNVYYVGSEGAILDWYVEGAWKDYRLGGSVREGTSPSVLAETGSGQNVFYVGSEGSILVRKSFKGPPTHVYAGGSMLVAAR